MSATRTLNQRAPVHSAKHPTRRVRRVRGIVELHDLDDAVAAGENGASGRTGFGLMRRFACGDGIVNIVQLDDAPHTSNPPGGVLGGCTGARWFSVRVADIEEALTRCEAAGARVVQPFRSGTTAPSC